MFPGSTLLLGSLGAPVQQSAVPCGHAHGSRAKITEFLPAHATATVQHPVAFIEKEGGYKRVQLTVSRSPNRRKICSRKPAHEQSLERSLRLKTASVRISLCRRKVCARTRFNKEIEDSGSAPMLKKSQQGTLKKARICDVNTACVRCLDQAWPPGLLLSGIVTLHSTEQGLAGYAKTPGACPILEERPGFQPSSRATEQPRTGAARTTLGSRPHHTHSTHPGSHHLVPWHNSCPL